MHRLSHGHDSTCATFPWSRKMFYILRTYVYDSWKLFYELLKSNSSSKNNTEWGAWQSFRELNFKNPLESYFSFDKKCFVGCTVMIQSALHFPDLGECFPYVERMRAIHEKFFTVVGSQSLCQKPTHFVSKALPSFRIFYHFVWNLAKTLTSDTCRKFPMRCTQTFWVCIAFSKIREM